MKTPAFWYQHSLTSRVKSSLLKPLSQIYHLGYLLNRARSHPHKPNTPLICIGNLVAGGSGKTPVALSVMKLIKSNALGSAPCFLSRGYGGQLSRETIFVDPLKHTATETGDEPLLLAREATTLISANRKKGLQAAARHGHDIIVMDDGLQNPHIDPHIGLVVIDGVAGFGNRNLLPAGPLREPVHDGLKRADAVILIGEDRHNVLKDLPESLPVFEARLMIDEEWLFNPDAHYIGFAGLGRPVKFKQTLEELKLTLVGWHAFADHHPYSEGELTALDEEALSKGARLITTEKDAVRFPSGFKWQSPLDILPVHLEWKDPAALKDFLARKIEAAA